MEQFRNDRLRPNLLAIELTEAKNGVSKLHARVANFRDRNNDKVKFHAITNLNATGLHLDPTGDDDVVQAPQDLQPPELIYRSYLQLGSSQSLYSTLLVV